MKIDMTIFAFIRKSWAVEGSQETGHLNEVGEVERVGYGTAGGTHRDAQRMGH